MGVTTDMAWKSLNKHGEELCGDKVEIVRTDDSDILILADGMGSGVKANILATLTSKILATMIAEGATIDECVETIASTLPICSERKVAYATFSILQISHDGDAYLIEYDNPDCVFVRNKEVVRYPYETREIGGKKIHEYRFKVEKGDSFVLMSDGVIYAGAGNILDLNGWTWDKMAEYTLSRVPKTNSASRLASVLSDACNELYIEKPGDDTTIAVARVVEERVVNLFTGPPKSMEDDERIMRDFMGMDGKKVISGGTSAIIAARVLGKEITNNMASADSDVPPTANIDGIDLVTEGVLTLNKALGLLKRYASDDIDADFFIELDMDNGASEIARMLIEDCTSLNMFVGTAINEAHTGVSFDLTVRMSLIDAIKDAAESMGKTVTVKYY